jgi:hypothetical protein
VFAAGSQRDEDEGAVVDRIEGDRGIGLVGRAAWFRLPRRLRSGRRWCSRRATSPSRRFGLVFFSSGSVAPFSYRRAPPQFSRLFLLDFFVSLFLYSRGFLNNFSVVEASEPEVFV